MLGKRMKQLWQVGGLVVFLVLLPISAPLAAGGSSWVGTAGDGLWETAANWSPSSIPQSTDDVIIDGGGQFITVTLSSPQIVNSLDVSNGATLVLDTGSDLTLTSASIIQTGVPSGTLDVVSGVLRVETSLNVFGTLYLRACALTGAGMTVVEASSGILDIFGSATLDGHIIQNDWQMNHSSGDFSMSNGASVLNTGNYLTSGDFGATISDGGGTASSITNQGFFTITKTSDFGVSFDNIGTLDISSGTATFTGPYLLNQVGGIVQGFGTLDVSATTFSSDGFIKPGTSPGILTITGDFAQSATGTLEIELEGTTAGNGTTDHDQLAISGTAVFAGSLTVTTPTYTPVAGDTFVIGTYGSHSGVLAAALPSLSIGLAWNVQYNSTNITLEVHSTDTSFNGCPVGNDFSWHTATSWTPSVVPTFLTDVTINDLTECGSVVTISGGNTANANSVTVAGSWTLDVGAASFLDVVGVTSIDSTANFNLAGDFIGTGDLDIAGVMNWTAGTISGSGAVNHTPFFGGGDAAATVNMSGVSTKTLDGRTFNNDGAYYWTDGSFAMINGAVFNNNSMGFFDIQIGPGNLTGTVAETFNNYGTVAKTAGGLNADIRVPFNNWGIVDVQTGSLKLSGDTVTNDTTGIIQGRGTVEIPAGTTFTNDGWFKPGADNDPGILYYIGSYTPTMMAKLAIDMDGTSAGNTTGFHDQLVVTGSADLGGELVGSLMSSYTTPVLGDTLTILTATGGITGTFDLLTLPDLSVQSLDWNVQYNDNDVTLEVVNGPVTWQGGTVGVETSWTEPNNWSTTTVPTSTDTVIIPSSLTYYPVLAASTTIKNLTIEPSATLSINAATILTVSGSVDAGTTITGAGTLKMTSGTMTSLVGTLSNLEVSGQVALGGDTTVTGNLTVNSGGSLGVNGYNLIVTSDLYVDLDATAGNGLIMGLAADTVTVGGDATFTVSSASSDSTGHFTDGVLSVGGNFTQTWLGAGYSSLAFVSTGTKVIFNGSGAQEVFFITPGSNLSHFDDVEISNAVAGVTFTSNVSIASQLTLGSGGILNQSLSHNIYYDTLLPVISSGTYNVVNTNINGNLGMTAGLDLSQVDNDLFIPAGTTLTLSGQSLNVGGDLHVTLDNSTGTGLIMTNVNDALSVEGSATFTVSTAEADSTGNFTDGMMNLRGDFIQIWPEAGYSAKAFISSGTTVIFDGTASQAVSFTNPGSALSRFFDVQINNTSGVNLNSDVSVLGLLTLGASGVVNQSASYDTYFDNKMPVINAGTYDVINTHVNGDIGMIANLNLPLATNHLFVDNGTTLTLNGFTLGVGGDLTVTIDDTSGTGLVMTNANDVLSVEGTANFAVSTVSADSTGNFTSGTIYLRDNFSQTCPGAGYSSLAFAATGTVVIFDGSQAQSISFATPGSSLSRFYSLQIDNTVGWVALSSNMTTDSILIQNGSILDISTHTSTVQTSLSNLGTIYGNGTFDNSGGATFSNSGIVSPGASPGRLTVQGGYTQVSGGTLAIELGGTTVGSQYDVLDVVGDVAGLNGTLNVTTINSFTPTVNNYFTILTATGGLVSTFTTENLPALAAGLSWDVAYNANDVILSVSRPSATWDGGAANGLWSDPGNWNYDTLPGVGEDVVIPVSSGTITINASPVVKSLSIATGNTINISGQTLSSTVGVSNHGTFNVTSDSTLAGPFTNESDGSLEINAGFTLTVTGSLINKGTLSLSTTFANATLQIDAGGTLLNDTSGTIEAIWATTQGSGYGVITGAGSTENFGTIEVIQDDIRIENTLFKHSGSGNVDIGSARTLTVTGGTFTGNGGGFSGTGFISLNSTILSLDADTTFVAGIPVTITSSTIHGGSILINQGTINLLGSNTFAVSVTNQGTVNVNADETITSAFTNESGGSLEINAGLTLTVTGSLINKGTLSLSTTFANATLQIDAGGTLLNDTSGTIEAILATTQGSGYGVITGAGSAENSGAIEVIQDDIRIENTSFTNTGTGIVDISSGRTLTVSGGSFANDPNGTMKGTGILDVSSATFLNNGIFAPGLSPGILSVTGAFPMSSANAVLDIEINGTAVGSQYDRLAITGNAALAGVLEVTLTNGFMPELGDSFMVLTVAGGTVIDTFATENLPSLTAGLNWDISYNANDVRLTVVGPDISASSVDVDFGLVQVGITSSAQTLTITNVGGADLTISTVSLSGTQAADFAVVADTCSGSTVVPAATCLMDIDFTPAVTGTRNASLDIASNDQDTPTLSIPLTGTGGYTLTVNKGGGGTGSVSSSPAGITCDPGDTDCSEVYTSNTAVTLTAMPVEGSIFSGWSGDCADIGGDQATVTMNADKSCTAYFDFSDIINPAVDATGLIWTTGGNGSFMNQSMVTSDGVDAAQSGLISDYQTTWMETTVTGPVNLSFYWKVSTLFYRYSHHLKFFIDGVEQASISGETDWHQMVFAVPTGSHTLKWKYSKGYGDAGSDAGWVDRIAFTNCDISPIDAIHPPVGGEGSIVITELQSACTWTATTDLPWLTVTSGASGSGSGVVTYSVDVNNDGVIRQGFLVVEGIEISVAQFDADPATVYVSNVDSDSVSVISPAGNRVIATVPVENEPRNLASNPSGTRLYVPNRHADSVSVIDTATTTVVETIHHSSFDEPYALAVTPDGREVWVANKYGDSVTIFSTADNTVTGVIDNSCFYSPEGIAMNPLSARAYVANRGDGSVCVVDTESRTVLADINVGSESRYAVVGPDGLFVYESSGYKINTADNSAVYVDIGGRNMAITAAGDKVYSADQWNEPTVLHTADDSLSSVYFPDASSTYGVALVPGTTLGYVSDEDNDVVWVFDTTTDTPVSGIHPIETERTPRGITAASTPTFSLSAAAFNFDSLATQTLTITNNNTLVVPADLTIGAISTDSGDFIIQNDTCSGMTLVPSESCSLEIDFPSIPVEMKKALLSIPSSHTGNPVIIPLAVGNWFDDYYMLREGVYEWDGVDVAEMSMSADDDNFFYDLPWSVYFYDRVYDRINIDSNGNIWFESGGDDYAFDLANAGDGPVISGWNIDLSSSYYGEFKVQHKTEPERVVIEWETETYDDEDYDYLNNFEIVIFPDGSIRFDYNYFNCNWCDGDYGSGISRDDNDNYISITGNYGEVYSLPGRSFLFELIDVDADLLPDWWESKYGLVIGTDDSNGDFDDDGLNNLAELHNFTDPSLVDTDSDGLKDGEEVYVYGTDPFEPDSDEDGLLDGEDVAFGTNPNTPDSDSDGIADGAEAMFESDPLEFLSGPAVLTMLGQTDGFGAQHSNALYTSGGGNDSGPTGLEDPAGMAVDPDNHRLFVADEGNDRVLVFQLDATNQIQDYLAVNVLGQPDFDHNDGNRNQGPGPDTLSNPAGVFYFNDGSKQWLLVADFSNERVVIYDITSGVTDGMAAAKVLGQADFISNLENRGAGDATCVVAGVNGGTLDNPSEVHVAQVGAKTLLIVSDTDSNRVLVWDISTGGISGLNNGQAANYVIGQPDFQIRGSNSCGTAGQATLDDPYGLAVWGNYLLIGDRLNDRVMAFDLGVDAVNMATTPAGLAATYVVGQSTFSGSSKNQGTGTIPAANYLADVGHLAVDGNYLFVAEQSNERVPVFDLTALATNMNASFVFGQGSFTTEDSNLTASGTGDPWGIAVGPGQSLFVGDDFYDRITQYDISDLTTDIASVPTSLGPAATNLLGQTDWYPGIVAVINPVFDTGGSDDTNVVGFTSPRDSVLGEVSGVPYLFVSDAYNARVMAFETDFTGVPLDLKADFVFGQPDFEHDEEAITASGMDNPVGVAFDQVTQYLYVADNDNSRVLVFDLSAGISTGMAALAVLGQPDFISGDINGGGTTPSQISLHYPRRLEIGTVDGTRYLFVADKGNARVMLFNLSDGVISTEPASHVLGSSLFTTVEETAGQSTMVQPFGMDFDESTGLLYVAEGDSSTSNPGNRVLVFNLLDGIVDGEPAVNVLGQPDYLTTAPGLSSLQLNYPQDVQYDISRDLLWVADSGNHRIIAYNIADGITNGEPAIMVLGQPDLNTGDQYWDGDRHQYTMDWPSGLYINGAGDIYIPQEDDDRLVIFNYPIADLEVSIVDDVDPVLVGDTVTYTVTVTNNGDVATRVKLSDIIPTGSTFDWSSTSHGTCVEQTPGEVVCDIGTLLSGETATVDIGVNVVAVELGSNEAEVSTYINDANPANDLVVEETQFATIVEFSQTYLSVNESNGTTMVGVDLVNSTSTDVTVDLIFSGNATGSGTDYTNVTGTTLTIPAESTSTFIEININDDLIEEEDESISIDLSNPSSNALIGSASTFTLDIQNNDTAGILVSEVYNGTALQFDGFDDYVVVPDSPSLDVTSEMTLSAWFYYQSGVSYDDALVQKDGPSSWGRYGLWLLNDQVNFCVYPDGGSQQCITSVQTLAVDGWYHVAGVYDGSDINLYLNGSWESSQALSGPISTSTESLYIGADPTDGLYTPVIVDEVRLWNAALDETTIYEWKHRPLDTSHPYFANLAGYWPLDDATGGTASDQSGNGNDGTLTNFTDPNSAWQPSTALSSLLPEGYSGFYDFVLTSMPAADVVVDLTPDIQVSLGVSSLTFTSTNWYTPQAVLVTAVDDGVLEGYHTGTITHTVTSTDGFYNGMTLADAVADITDFSTDADLSITKTVDAATVTSGSHLTYTLDVVNNGPTSASNVTVVDELPDGASLVSATTTIGTNCTLTDGILECPLGLIPNGAAVTINVEVVTSGSGAFRNVAVAVSDTDDPDVKSTTGLTVDGQNNIFGAGKTSAPGGGLLPTEFSFQAGTDQVVFVSDITGTVSGYTGGCGYNEADGGQVCADRTYVTSSGGISGIKHDDLSNGRTMFLTGVFVNDTTPVDPAPSIIDFSNNDTFASAAPELRQTVFVGDGLTGTGAGARQFFHVPVGATRMFFGFAETMNFVGPGAPGAYYDNGGTISGYVTLVGGDNVAVVETTVQAFPVAVDDNVTVAEDDEVLITVLTDNGNGADNDADGSLVPSSVAWVSGITDGSLVNNNNGTFTYTPDPDFNGQDEFDYQVDDNDGLTSNIATVTIDVTPLNDQPVNIVLPSVAGNYYVGEQLAADSGAWNDDRDLSSTYPAFNPAYTYQWQRADDDTGTNNTDISGATASAYTLTVVDSGQFIRVQVSITDDGEGTPTSQTSSAVSEWSWVNNSAPVISQAGPLTVTMDEDGVPTGWSAPTITATDVDEDTLIWSVFSGPSNGSATVSGSGVSPTVFIYAPDAGWNGDDSFEIQVSDGVDAATIRVDVTVNPINDAPVNNGVPTVSGTHLAGQELTASIGDWDDLQDFVPGTLTYTHQWQRADDSEGTGSTAISGATAATYILTAADSGKYIRVQVIATDDGEGTPTSQNTSAVSYWNQVNNSPPVISQTGPLAVIMDEDGSPTSWTVPTVTATDVDDDTLTWSVSSDPSSGSAMVSGSGASPDTFTYTPDAGWNGDDSFVVQVFDGAEIDSITVNVTVNPINDPPVNNGVPFVNGTYLVGQELTASSGDWDDLQDFVPGTLTYTYQWQRADDSEGTGSTAISGATAATYILTAADSGKYIRVQETATDNGEGTPTSQNTSAVSYWNQVNNSPPVISQTGPLAVIMDEDDSPTSWIAPAVDAVDVDNDTLTWSLFSDPSNGSATVSGTGASPTVFTYTPDAGWNGDDSFEIQVSDGVDAATIRVDVTVNPINDAPVNNGVPTVSGTHLAGQELTASIGDWDDLQDFAPGTLTYTHQWQRADDGAGAGSTDISDAAVSTYTLTAADSGRYIRVQVTATDDGEGTPTSQSTTAVSSWDLVNNSPPIISQTDPLTATQDEDGTPVGWSAPTVGATDLDDDTLSWSLSGNPSNGTAVVSGTGPSPTIFTYTPAVNWNGLDSFELQVADGKGGTDTVLVNVTVNPINDPPINTGVPTVSGAYLVGQELTADKGSWDDQVDLVPGSLTYSYQWQRADDGTGSNSTDITNAASSIYTLTAADSGKYVRVMVTGSDDGEGLPSTQSNSATSSWSMVDNTAPTITQADPVTVSMDEDNSPTAWAAPTLIAADVDDDTLTWSVSSNPVNGTATVSGSGVSPVIFVYAPTTNWHGNDSFIVQVADGKGGVDTIAVEVIVDPVNDAPEGAADSYTTFAGGTLTVEANNGVLDNDTDQENDPLSAVLVSGPNHASAFSLNSDGSFTYTHDGGSSMADSFVYKVSDGNLQSTEVTVTLNATVNTPPAQPARGAGHVDGEIFEPGKVKLTSAIFSDPDVGDMHVRSHWQVRLFSRPVYDYQKITTDQGLYEADFATLTWDVHPANEPALIPGLKYYWKVGHEDLAGNISWSDEGFFAIGVIATSDTEIIPAGTTVTNYRMVSIDYWPENPSCEAVFDITYDTTQFRIGIYDPMSGGYFECSDGLEIEPGRSYWMLAREGSDVTVQGVAVPLDQDVEVPLLFNENDPAFSVDNNGWNMIAPPNARDYYWDDIEVVHYDSDGNLISGPFALSDPNSAALVDPQVWVWENGNYAAHLPSENPLFVLEQRKGYWVQAMQAGVSLRFKSTVRQVVSAAQSDFWLASVVNYSSRWLKKWVFVTSVHADAGDAPPMPMDGLVTGGGAAAEGGGGGCFIATAAYGSYMEPHVEILKDFRDRILLPTGAGKQFVKMYYEYSPPLADFIAGHDTWRAVVRVALLPLVGISSLFLFFGPIMSLVIMFTTLMMFCGIIITFRRIYTVD